jgi:hypothetical protein
MWIKNVTILAFRLLAKIIVKTGKNRAKNRAKSSKPPGICPETG